MHPDSQTLRPHRQALALALISADGRDRFFAHPDHEAFVSCEFFLYKSGSA
jgi:hypothetical protein